MPRCGISIPPMTAWVMNVAFRYLRGTSAYPPRLAVKADIPDRQVGPIAVIRQLRIDDRFLVA